MMVVQVSPSKQEEILSQKMYKVKRVVEYLPSKFEALSSKLQYHHHQKKKN
jgi:hypothetical protein